MPKVWNVEVQVTVNVPVVAETREQAEEIGIENWEEEKDNGVEVDISAVGYEITGTPEEFKGCIPYGPDDDAPRRDWTIEQWLKGG